MNLTYTPLLPIQRRLQTLPRDRERFKTYLRTISNTDGTDIDLLPMLAMNPMGKEHVTALVDELMSMDADGIAARAVADLANEHADLPGDYRAALIVADDLMGGWTNRWAYEFDFRVGYGPGAKRFWGPFGILWSSEPASVGRVKVAIRTAVYRTAYMQRHGRPSTLREIMIQEGRIMAQADCVGPMLEAEDMEHTRELLVPFLDASDKRTIIECLFGDAAGATLGFTPRGLSPWAGIALALHDAQMLAAKASVTV
ncbi:MAG TPA: hypothetical protein VHR66_18095 [Gemmataceae bacterium]|jgi:hypothetical protein|nr:hypothetical protein [Gemmataceae bacterium]